MDIVTDLTAETVSYIVLIQDILKSNSDIKLPENLVDKSDWIYENVNVDLVNDLTVHQKEKILDLIWHSPEKCEINGLVQKYFERIISLLFWLPGCFSTNEKTVPSIKDTGELILSKTPFFWRQKIRSSLYNQSEKRLELVVILQYMPLQVILAITGKGKLDYAVRLYQFYEKLPKAKPQKSKPYADYDLLGYADREDHFKFWSTWRPKAIEYLKNDQKLLNELKSKEFPLPFETFFREELIEISRARELRIKQFVSKEEDDKKVEPSSVLIKPEEFFDPLAKATSMKLRGIALSGGGIRSATFNLGILQGLASQNKLHQFDYISTVSGGGYIGSWFTSWIHRSGSFSRINDRLCSDKSGDPFADEVRPIRWLRMFSNYLSPNVGIMSADAWTTGMTWLRNAVVNQFVLLLSLLTILSFISNIYFVLITLRNYIFKIEVELHIIFFISLFIFMVGALLVATAMRSFYNIEKKELTDGWLREAQVFILRLARKFKQNYSIPHLIVFWGGISSLLISTYFAASEPPEGDKDWFSLLLVLFASAFLSFFLVALRGNYHKRWDLMEIGKKNVATQMNNKNRDLSGQILFTIFGSTFIASALLVYLLMLFWSAKNCIYEFANAIKVESDKMFLVVSVPIILEIFSISVILRMALMGNLFPDYRREWWGRMGGYIHRFMLIWTIVTFAALIMPELWKNYRESIPWSLALSGGWAGIIGWGLKRAFESRDETQIKGKSYITTLLKIIPFIFMIGILLIGSGIMDIIKEYYFFSTKEDNWQCIYLTLILAAITLLLSWRVGVNEFSLHHFYRNRLVRAFLGATRSREDRIKTANVFTGFDANDDILLSSICVQNGYAGPFPLVNSTLNATVVNALDRQDRMGESFVFSPLYCGYDFSPTRPSTYNIDHVYEYGYRPTAQFSNENGGPTLGTAMAISGAAVNPNWGYHSSATMAFLLTLFNLRLGWWMGNPRLDEWKRPDPKFGLLYLMRDLIGKSDVNMKYVCLSDGGHFDNMGLYELVRRRCDYILIGDGEEDKETTCEGLANAIRRCRIDFGVEIDFGNEINKIRDKTEHRIEGTITYPGIKQKGTIIYIKTVVIEDESVDVREYALSNEDFPHQSTGDQFFDEAQFESYRKLGYHSVKDL